MVADIRTGILETANALGMDPVELATIISYETGGTFDPAQRGPTTKWGQHRGLIQFGEPQAYQYGVNWNDPLGSQLGPNGAVARYFLDRGWRPGMGMLDAYSIVNAGAPGQYNASDRAAGGAPGTVREKVEQQMGGHRRKAEELLQGLNTRRPYGPLEAAGGGERPDRFTASPSGPVEAAGGGAGSDAGQYTLPTPYAPPAAPEKEKKNLWQLFGEGIADAAGAMGKVQSPGYQVAGTPGPARVDVAAAPMIDPQAAEMRRQMLALALQRLNQGVLF